MHAGYRCCDYKEGMESLTLLKIFANVFCGLTIVFLMENNLIVFRGHLIRI